MNTDPIADMLTRIRNARMSSKTETSLPYSKIKHAIAQILVTSDYIVSAKQTQNGVFKRLELVLNDDSKTVKSLSKLIRLSKPGRRVYAKAKDIPTVLSGQGIVIVSTSKGLMTGHQAKKAGLGGELVCKVY